MRILFFVLVFLLMFYIDMDVFNVHNMVTLNDEKILEIEYVEDKALYCKKTSPAGSTTSCWFCDCTNLPDPD